ncbi:MAG: hypothetical protein ACK5OX_00730 [Desertimonas sp.]
MTLGGLLRRPRLVLAAATGLLVLPLVVALVALHGRDWHPVLDLAMTEFRVRDVGTANTPLIGLPGRIGTYPDQGSHPGPLSFYVVAVGYRLTGSSPWGMELGTAIVHTIAVATALWIGYRRRRWAGVAAVAALVALVVRGFGQVVLVQPWNPYLPVVMWAVVLVSLWAVFDGDDWMLVPLAAAASFCAQTHVPYLPLGVGCVVIGAAAWGWRKRSDPAMTWRPPLVALGVGLVLWLPPFLDQATNRPGNISVLLEHFGTPPEAAVGVREGVRLALHHLDAWTGVVMQVTGTERFLTATSAWRGLVVLLVWLVAAAVASVIGSRSLRALHGVVAVGLLLGTISMARIFGRAWYYLMLWAWVVTLLAVAAVVWTALTWWRRRAAEPAVVTRRAAIAAAGLAVVASLSSGVAFADAEHAEPRLSRAVGDLGDQVADAIDAGAEGLPGPDGRYLVRWSDAADIGSPGFGLLAELERRGYDVAADEFFAVQVTPHRAEPPSWVDVQLHLATGGYIQRWDAVPEATRIASYDPRTPGQLDEYQTARARLAQRFEAEGLGDLVEQIDTNLFGLAIDTRLSSADLADLAVLIDIGQPMAVYVAPPGIDDAPGEL